jgi:hypothetical protein
MMLVMGLDDDVDVDDSCWFCDFPFVESHDEIGWP